MNGVLQEPFAQWPISPAWRAARTSLSTTTASRTQCWTCAATTPWLPGSSRRCAHAAWRACSRGALGGPCDIPDRARARLTTLASSRVVGWFSPHTARSGYRRTLTQPHNVKVRNPPPSSPPPPTPLPTHADADADAHSHASPPPPTPWLWWWWCVGRGGFWGGVGWVEWGEWVGEWVGGEDGCGCCVLCVLCAVLLFVVLLKI